MRNFIAYYCLVVRTAFRHSLDHTQTVLFVLFIGAGAATAFVKWFSPKAAAMIPDVSGWQIAAGVLGSIVLARLVLAPYWIYSEQKEKLTVQKDAEDTPKGSPAKLIVRINDAEPYAFSQGPWVFRRFGIFNDGAKAAENINVQLRAIRPKPVIAVGALDLPLSAWTSGGPDPLILKILPKDEALCTVFDACPERVGVSPSIRWEASQLGRGHTFMPSIFLENEGRWEFDYVIQSSNADEILFTLVVRANANGIIVEKKS